MRSVDDWPLAKISNRYLGVNRVRYPISGVTRDALTFLGVLLLKGICHRLGVVLRGRTSICGGPLFGELSEGKWMIPGRPSFIRGCQLGVECRDLSGHSCLVTISALVFWGLRWRRRPFGGVKTALR
jgi:hypothetical protein